MTTKAEMDREFDEMWNGQMLDYPTITMKPDGTLDYFSVEPARGEVKDFNARGAARFIDGADDADVQWMQGEELAVESLVVASQIREADSCALECIMSRALELQDEHKHPLQIVAVGFVHAVLAAAVERYSR